MWHGPVSSASAYPLAPGLPVKSPTLEPSGSVVMLGCQSQSPQPQVAASYQVQDAAGIAVTLQSFENRVRSLEGELAKAQQKVNELTAVLHNRSPSPNDWGEADGQGTPRSMSNGRRTPGRRNREAWNPGGNPNPRDAAYRSPRRGNNSPGARISQKREAARAGAFSYEVGESGRCNTLSSLLSRSSEGFPPMSPSRGQSVSSTPSCNGGLEASMQRAETPTYINGVKGRYNLSPRASRRLRSASPRELRHDETKRRQGKMPSPTPPPRVPRRFNAPGFARKSSSMKDMRRMDVIRGDHMASMRSPQTCAYCGHDGLPNPLPPPPDYVPSAVPPYAAHYSPSVVSSVDAADEPRKPLIQKQASHPFINFLFERGWAHRPPPTTSTLSCDGKEEPVVLSAEVVHEFKEADVQHLLNTGTAVTPTSSSMPIGSGSLTSAMPASPQVQLSSVQSMPNMHAPLKGSLASSESASLTSQQSTAIPPTHALRSPGSSTQEWQRQYSDVSGDSTPTLPPSVSAAPSRATTGPQQAPRPPAVASQGPVVAGRAWPVGPASVPPTVVHCAGYVSGRLSRSSLGSVSGVSTVSSLSSPAPTRMLRAASAAYVRPTTQARPVQTSSCRVSPGPAQLRTLPGGQLSAMY